MGSAFEASFDVLPVFFDAFGIPVLLPRIFACFGILFLHDFGLVFGLYLVKLTFLQNIVNYDVWHIFGPLHVAGSAFEASFDVLAVFFFHAFGTPALLPRIFARFGI